MRLHLLPTIFYVSMAVLLIGMLFHIQHWAGGSVMLFGGDMLATIFFLLVILEILSSRKAYRTQKLGWAALYLFGTPVIFLLTRGLLLLAAVAVMGFIYLYTSRKHFLYRKKDTEHIQFDSI